MWARTPGGFLAVETALSSFLCKKKKTKRKKKIVYFIENIEDEDFIALIGEVKVTWGVGRAPVISCVSIETSGHNIDRRGKRTASSAGSVLCYKISHKQITKENDFTRIILHSCFSPLYTYMRKTVNVVGHGSSKVGPTICSVGLFTVYVIILNTFETT